MSPLARPLRVGLAGAGWVAPHHLEAWARLGDRASVVAIADPDLSAARARADRFHVPAVYESVEAMLERESLDAIDIAAPRELHAPLCRQALRHRLPILCQKPLAPTFAEAERLVADIGDRVPFMVHENWRFRPHYRRMSAWLREGLIGDVRTVNVSLLTSGLLPDATGALPALVRQPMLATLERLLLMEVLIHLVDTMRFLFGPLTLRAASVGHSCPEVRGEDRATLLLATREGAAVTIAGDFMATGYPPEQFDRVEILGTRGAITLVRDRLLLDGVRKEELALDLASHYSASYAAAIAHFVDGLDGNHPFETNARDNLETLRIIESAYESARSK